MRDSIGTAVIFCCVFLCGAASMVLLEKFEKVPRTCQVTPEVYDAFSRK